PDRDAERGEPRGQQIERAKAQHETSHAAPRRALVDRLRVERHAHVEPTPMNARDPAARTAMRTVIRRAPAGMTALPPISAARKRAVASSEFESACKPRFAQLVRARSRESAAADA